MLTTAERISAYFLIEDFGEMAPRMTVFLQASQSTWTGARNSELSSLLEVGWSG
jgi:hypothetical protein